MKVENDFKGGQNLATFNGSRFMVVERIIKKRNKEKEGKEKGKKEKRRGKETKKGGKKEGLS